MSYIQLISSNNESSYYSTNFSDIIKIKPNSKIALIDCQVNRDARLDFSDDADSNRVYTFSIYWGSDGEGDDGQGGVKENYTFNPRNLPEPYNNVTFLDFVKHLEFITDTGTFKNYKLNFDLKTSALGTCVKIQSENNYLMLNTDGMRWDSTALYNNGFVDDNEQGNLDEAIIIRSQGGTLNPDGDYTHNYIITDNYIQATGGMFGARINAGLSTIVGLSYIDPTEFGTQFFTSSTDSEFWNLINTIWEDVPTGTFYRLDAGVDMDTYSMINLATSVTYGVLTISNIRFDGAGITLTNAANAGGVLGEMFAGDYGIGKATLTDGGSGYVAGIFDVDSYGNGQGARIEVLTVDGSGGILTWRIIDEGQGYILNNDFILDGGNRDAFFKIVRISTFIINWSASLPSAIQLWFRPDHVSNVNYPKFIQGLADIPIGVHLTTNDNEDDMSYIIYKHFGGADYNPYNRDNIDILETGSISNRSIDVLFQIGLNQEIDISIIDPWGTGGITRTYKLHQGDIPTLAQLRGIVLSDCLESRTEMILYERPRSPLTETFYWVGNQENIFNDRKYLRISVDFTGGLDRILGIEKNDVINSGYLEVDFLTGDQMIQTQGEGHRINICIDNLNMKSFKNFANDYTGIQNGFISGVADRIIGSLPTWINNKNYGVLYFQPTPIYIDLDNPSEIRVNRLVVSLRDVETNKLVTDLYGSSIITIHIKN